MKVKVADWIADHLVECGITHNFTVPGGGAMNMNMALGFHPQIKNVFMQHEQAAAIAAEAYARVENKLALVCVTSGPGGTNALTGVLGAWLDSIPMLVISGQVRYTLMARSTGLDLRAMGPQEYDIVKPVSYMTKYAVLVTDPLTVKYHIDKAIYLATHGRPGPVWLDVTLDVQGATIEDNDLIAFDPLEEGYTIPEASDDDVCDVIRHIVEARRPVIIAGNGIRLSGGFGLFKKVIELLGVPVTTCWDSIDMIEDDSELYVGRAGTMGDRPGNWAVQTSDYILSIGSRLNTYQVGYNRYDWAPKAYVTVVDVDSEELKKPTVHINRAICSDARLFLKRLFDRLEGKRIERKKAWLETCMSWKKRYPVVQSKHYENGNKANVYCFIREMSSKLEAGQITVVGNGSASVVGSSSYVIKEKQRFIMNNGCSTMGYDLPASIGACFASGRRKIICVTGDGSIQMNIQELQTIVFHRLPIKIFVINNQGYHQMRQTENNLFPGSKKVGIGPESMDLSFPNMGEIANAYKLQYYKISNNYEISKVLSQIVLDDNPVLCEVLVDTVQPFEPKSATKKLDDGTFVSAPLEDLSPFLSREELVSIMKESEDI